MPARAAADATTNPSPSEPPSSNRPTTGAPAAWPSSAATKNAEAAGPGVRETCTAYAISTEVPALNPRPKSSVAAQPVQRSLASGRSAVAAAIVTRQVTQARCVPRRSSAGVTGAESAEPTPRATQAQIASVGATPERSSAVRP